MSSIPEHDEERNSTAAGQNDQTPIDNEDVAGNVPNVAPTITPGEGQERASDNAIDPKRTAEVRGTQTYVQDRAARAMSRQSFPM